MDRNSQTLLSLLRSAMWGLPADEVCRDTEWGKVFDLAREQTVLGLVADAVGKLPYELKPDKDVLVRMQHHVMRSLQAHALLDRKLAETVALLRSHDIHPVLFKGQGLATNYPDPKLRQCGDIDLYVGEGSYMKACDVVISAFGTDEHDSESVKHMHLNNGGVTIELHRIAEKQPGFFEDRRYQAWTLKHLEHSDRRKVQIGGETIELPPVNFDAVYIMNHAWHHFVNGGIGLRQVCDWTLYVHRFHKEVDADILKKDLKSLNLWKVWHLFACIAVEHLGLPSDECPFYDGSYSKTAERVLDIILDEGNFGRYSEARRKSRRPAGYASGKIHSFKMTTSRYARNFTVHPTYMVRAWLSFMNTGVKAFFKGLR